MTIAWTFTVYGTPAGQGSKTRTRHGLVDDNHRDLKPWREAVRSSIVDELAERPRPVVDGPVEVRLRFNLKRPRKHYRTGKSADQLRADAPTWHAGKPDVDKLARAVLDAMTDAGVFADDKQVARLIAAKAYDDTRVGVVIHVCPAPAP